MLGIDSFIGQYEFDEDKPDSAIVIGIDDKKTMAKFVGHADKIAIAIANAMIENPVINDMVCAAHEACGRYRNKLPDTGMPDAPVVIPFSKNKIYS